MIYWHLSNVIMGTMLLMIVYTNVIILRDDRLIYNWFCFVVGLGDIVLASNSILKMLPA